MTINRRELLTGLGGLAAMTALRVPARANVAWPQGAFPRKADFMIEEGYTYLNAAYTHPIQRRDHAPARVAQARARRARGATGSTMTNLALLASSLTYVKSLGVANIQAHRLPLIRKLQAEVPRFGFTAVTPPDATGGNISFARKGLAESDVPRRLAAAKVNVRLGRDWMRLSPSVYNDMSDVDRFLEALA